MRFLSPRAAQIMKHPGGFALHAVQRFFANQGLLLAGAVAYYALLSIVPLLILVVIVLSHIFEQAELLSILGHYLEWLVPSQSKTLILELTHFLDNRAVIGWVMLGVLLFFSSLGFAVLDKAMAVIFHHPQANRHRHFLVTALLPYCFILIVGIGLLALTMVASGLEAIGQERLVFGSHALSLGGLSGGLLYLLGLLAEVFALAAVYYVMPLGRVPLSHALLGGATAALLWEIIRRVLVWYFATLSQASVVYGSLATTIIVLLTLEIGATLLLFGAQVIAEYEHIEVEGGDAGAR